MAALLTLVLGATGSGAWLPWLFPSLAPTIMLQVHKPEQPSSQAYNVILGHAAGIVGGILVVLLAQAGDEPSALAANLLTWPRVWASVIAMVVMLIVTLPARASHPPAAAKALLISLGGFSVTSKSMLVLAWGILLVAALGDATGQGVIVMS